MIVRRAARPAEPVRPAAMANDLCHCLSLALYEAVPSWSEDALIVHGDGGSVADEDLVTRTVSRFAETVVSVGQTDGLSDFRRWGGRFRFLEGVRQGFGPGRSRCELVVTTWWPGRCRDRFDPAATFGRLERLTTFGGVLAMAIASHGDNAADATGRRWTPLELMCVARDHFDLACWDVRGTLCREFRVDADAKVPGFEILYGTRLSDGARP